MSIRNNSVDDFINHIKNICKCKNIVHYCIELIERNMNDITEITSNELRALKFGEVLELSIGNNYFTIYSTNWGTTERRKLTFLRVDDVIILSIDNNEIRSDGKILENHYYKFKSNEFVEAHYSKSVDLAYEINNEMRQVKKKKKIEIFALDQGRAKKKIEQDGECSYYDINIGDFGLNDISTFMFLNGIINNRISQDQYMSSKVRVMK